MNTTPYGEHREQGFLGAKPVFSITTGRTGTVNLVHRLNNINSIRAMHEGIPPLYVPGADLKRLNHQMSRASGVLAMQWLRGWQVNLAWRRQQIYVELAPNMAWLSEYLMDAFRDARFVHLVRDPRSYVVSSLNKGHWKAEAKGFSTIFPRLAGEKDPSWRQAMTYWADTHKHGLQLEKRYGSIRVRRVYCHELWKQDRVFDELVTWICGGSPEHAFRHFGYTDAPKDNSGPEIGPRAKWDKCWEGDLHRICGPVMQELGYE